ncbi:hypothetical protein GALMADRAFT_233683 [Galerina marginata CBS 339.88]|uniref:Phosphatidylglycerol/phosphatidylinositol transfer protein n=1 Tax=Galerina marginata (strain CBS 339.88) TaxID=685588 RepID=A0A067TYK9_GALM3|nr:hypothetical protein GALMADRAFT_233683 [Galerina marginata CBS 339.88]
MRPFFLLAVAFGIAVPSMALSVPDQQPIQNVDSPVHTNDGWSYVDCGLPSDAVEIKSISVSPDPPQPGQDLTVTVEGTAKQEIVAGAYADVVVKLGVVKILTKRFDVCEEARGANASIQCPVQQGTYTVSQTVALPKEIPKAKFVVAVTGYTADEEDMLCLQIKVDFMKRPFPRFW